MGNSLAVANVAIGVWRRRIGVIIGERRWIRVGRVVLDGWEVGQRMNSNCIKNLWS